MIDIRRSDIKLLSHIREKVSRMDRMQSMTNGDVMETAASQTDLGFFLMEQIDTLKQLKEIEGAICNDHQSN